MQRAGATFTAHELAESSACIRRGLPRLPRLFFGSGFHPSPVFPSRGRGLRDASSVRDWLRAHVAGNRRDSAGQQQQQQHQPEQEQQQHQQHQQQPGGQQQRTLDEDAAAPETAVPMAVDSKQHSAVPAEQPAAQGVAEQQQCHLELGPGFMADQQAAPLEHSRGQRDAAPLQLEGQGQQAETLCTHQQRSEGDVPAVTGPVDLAAAAAAHNAAHADVAAGLAAAGAGPEGQAEPAQRRQQLLPGEVGWFQVKGYPHWPFLVITREEAAARGVPGQGAGPGPVGSRGGAGA